MRHRRDDEFLLTGRRAGRDRAGMGLSFAVLVMISIALMVLSRLDHSYIRTLRLHITEWVTPLLSATRTFVRPAETAVRRIATRMDRAADIEALARQVKELESWKWRAQHLERQVLELTRASRVAAEPVMAFTTARVVATSTRAVASSAVIAAGRTHGVRTGYPVIDADGLVGRIVDAGETSARVLLASDPASRIPVEFGQPVKRGIVTGDGTAAPRLGHVRFAESPSPGDEVVTSGVGGIYP
ncbi:MAG: rod shape-determining protein MreC, partial [Hyphomicrobiaceae bacterium]